MTEHVDTCDATHVALTFGPSGHDVRYSGSEDPLCPPRYNPMTKPSVTVWGSIGSLRWGREHGNHFCTRHHLRFVGKLVEFRFAVREYLQRHA